MSLTPDEIEELLPQIFTPATPVSDVRLLRGRDQARGDVATAMARRGAHIVLYGERGVGKSSVARIESQFAQEEPYYYSVSATDTFGSIMAAILQNYGVAWAPATRTTNDSRESHGSLGARGLAIGRSRTRGASEAEQPIEGIRLTPQLVASRLPDKASLVVIDDFERLVDLKDRAAFSDLIKKLSDNENPTTLMLVGISENVGELLAAHESSERSIVEVRVERLLASEIKDIINVGSQALGVSFDPDVARQIVDYSARFPYYTHLLCEGAVVSLIARMRSSPGVDAVVTSEDLGVSIAAAIRNAQQSIVGTYNDAVRSITQSPRFKYCLYAISSWPGEPVPYGEICKWVGNAVKAASGSVNVSHQLKRLETLGVIERPASGFYQLRNPMLKAYVILKARADSPGHELRAIDAHLAEIGKRIERVKGRM